MLDSWAWHTRCLSRHVMSGPDQMEQAPVRLLVTGAPTPLYVQLADALRARIKSGAYQPDDRLPSEHDLVREFSVSRITARQALAALEREGLVFRLQGRGSFVARPPVVQRLTRLSGFAEAMADHGVHSVSRVLRTGRARAATEVAAALALPPGAAAYEIRRVRLADGEPVSLDVSWFPLDLGARLARENLAAHDVFWLLEHTLGVPLGDADHEIAAVAAEEDVALHLGVPCGTPILLVERLTRDAGGAPIDYEHLYVRTDRIRYGLRLARRQAGSER
jgi:GntR family transcriptional regulator